MPVRTKAELEVENEKLYGHLEAIHEQISEVLYACDDQEEEVEEDDISEEDDD
ncbi:MAG: hypothetical protein M3Z17_04140 [Gemmatimonadota bacterium]|nr:hypothetical protein [Gemmatimonadota bacterium]